MTTYEEAIAFLSTALQFGSRLGLDRMHSLMRRLGGVPHTPTFIHIAGTNGKGSVTSFLSSALASAGYRTGIFTSPHLLRMEERVRILDGLKDLEAMALDERTGEIPPEALIRTVARVEQATKAMLASGEEHPTEFELITAVAFLYFADRGCDVVVLETGLGGRLDSTNILESPAVCVLTAMGYDHCDRLGDTMTAIASEKAGIVKSGSHVILLDPTASGTPEDAETVEAIVRARCEAVVASLRIVRSSECLPLSYGFTGASGRPGQTFRLSPPGIPLETTMMGAYQIMNAATAYRALEELIRIGMDRLDARSIQRGFRLAHWPARFELLSIHPPVLADGAHNPQGAIALRSSLVRLVPDRPLHLICGVSSDKDYRTMFQELLFVSSLEDGPGRIRPISLRCIAADNPRALSPEDLAAAVGELVAGAGLPLRIECPPDIDTAIHDAIREAHADGGAICVFGSLFLMGDVRSLLLARQDASPTGKEHF